MRLEPYLEAKPIGTFSIAGAQMKVVAEYKAKLRCLHCGWSVTGRLEDGHLVADVSPEE